ncbi:MAG TPA: hypothetical protein PLE35_05055, partial [Lentisphaeria bacterium]|nr:hypothetical protein [Lentisphaeria bacterium]
PENRANPRISSAGTPIDEKTGPESHRPCGNIWCATGLDQEGKALYIWTHVHRHHERVLYRR